MSYYDAIYLIKSNGGIPIIAHPGMNLRGKEDIVVELLDNGAEGIEVFNNYHDNKQMEYFANLTLQRSSLMTGGSDFHGKNKPLIDIGKYRIIEKYQNYLLKSITGIKNNKYGKLRQRKN
jgi:predicted metal-dependent phosphoesterase TrpH